MSVFSESELPAKAYILLAEKLGIIDEQEKTAILTDIEEPKRQAIEAGQLPQSVLPDIFEVVADAVSSAGEAVLDVACSIFSDS